MFWQKRSALAFRLLAYLQSCFQFIDEMPQKSIKLFISTTAVIVLLTISASSTAANSPDTKGTDFWLTFPGNINTPTTLSLFITGDTDTTGTVNIPGLAFSQPFTVAANTITTVNIPTTADLGTSVETLVNKGIHVTAQNEVTIYGLNRHQFTTDAYLGLPTDILGQEYIVLGYKNTSAPDSNGTIFDVKGSQFAIVAPQDGTQVTITPAVTTGAHPAEQPYTITLNQGQTYQLSNEGPSGEDLTGTTISASQPVAVFGGHRCPFIPGGFFACDHVVEQLPPTETWGREFVTMPLATRKNGDTFRILAEVNGTQVQINGATVATLNSGQFHEQIITGPAQITASEPVLVAQYSNSEVFDNVISDPFMMLIPPFEQFLGDYTISTPATGFQQNFVNIVAPDTAVGQITLNNVVIPAGEFTAIGSSGFSGAQIAIPLGSHHLKSNFPFGAFVYGFDSFDSYGYPGGNSLAPVVNATLLTLTPETATNPIQTEQCFTATVTDQNNTPIEGLRVDFETSGVNSETGFALTEANGSAQFCYTGLNIGTDTVTASSGELSDTSEAVWTPLVELAVQKTPNINTLAAPGGTVEFTLNITNNGSQDVSILSLVDAPYGDLADNNNPLISNSTCATGSTIVANNNYSCSFQVDINGQPGDYTDIVTVTAEDSFGTQGSASGSATVTIISADSTLTIIKFNDKNANGLQETDELGLLGWNFTVTGTSTNVAVANGATNGEGKITIDLTAGNYEICEQPQADWFASTQAGSCQPLEIAAGQAKEAKFGNFQAKITLENQTNGVDADLPPGPELQVGDPVAWTYLVENAGEVLLTNIQVTDDQLGTICTIGQLSPKQNTTCTANGTAEAGQYVNLATVTATAPQNNSVSDTDISHYFGGGTSVWNNICQPQRMEITGIGLGDHSTSIVSQSLSLADPANVNSVLAQMSGRLALNAPAPNAITINSTLPQSIVLNTPTTLTDNGYTFETPINPTDVYSVTVDNTGSSYHTPRAFTLYAHRKTTEAWTSVGRLVNEFVWKGSRPEHTELLAIPPLEQETTIYITAVVIDNDTDNRPIEVEASAGGVTQTASEINPSHGAGLNIVTLILEQVPAGTEQIAVVSKSLYANNGDSSVLVGLNASYQCLGAPNQNNGGDSTLLLPLIVRE